MKKRMKGAVRKAQITDVGLQLAATYNYRNVSARMIADEIGVSPATVIHHCSTMPQLRRAIMRRALETGDYAVVAQGLAYGDPLAQSADSEVIEKALRALGGLHG